MLKQLAASIVSVITLLTSFDVSRAPGISGNGFYSTCGNSFIAPEGGVTVLRGMGFGNNVWEGSLAGVGLHHNEDSFREMKELGFNSVRFLLNYRWFEDDEKPFSYKQEGFDYIDQSISWAKKYGIGIVLNMHYPQGGYQSQGNGTALWTDTSNQDRLVKLWGEIARRYADEPTIIGYGLINEPVVPLRTTIEDSTAQCQRLMQRCADEIRTYDVNHILFVERVAAVKDMTTGKSLWGTYSTDDLWFTIDDTNVAYETHFYGPHTFTHQTEGDDVSYPQQLYVTDYESYWTGCISAQQVSGGYFESELFTVAEDYNLFAPTLHSNGIGAGLAAFDDVAVTDYAPDGSSRIIWYNDFSEGCELPQNEWSSNGTGSYSVSGGMLSITGGTGDYVLTFDPLELEEGHSYRISGHMQTTGVTTGIADIRADFSRAKHIYHSGREYVFAQLSEAVRFGRENNVPIYLGEFGADYESFKNGLGGEKWVADVMDFCNDNGISYSYHAYHEPMFGLYPENTGNYPQQRNEALAEVFRNKNRNVNL